MLQLTYSQLLNSSCILGHETKELYNLSLFFIPLEGTTQKIVLYNIYNIYFAYRRTLNFLLKMLYNETTLLFVYKKIIYQQFFHYVAQITKFPTCTGVHWSGLLTNFFIRKHQIRKFRHQKKLIDKPLKWLQRLPDAIVISDINSNLTLEALLLGIPIIGLIDTNNNPTYLTYTIYSNNDSMNSIGLTLALIFETIRFSYCLKRLHYKYTIITKK